MLMEARVGQEQALVVDPVAGGDLDLAPAPVGAASGSGVEQIAGDRHEKDTEYRPEVF